MKEKERCPITNKVCYSRHEAAETLAWFKRTRGKHGKLGKSIPTRSYLCKFCGTYHLTHYRNKRGCKSNI